MEEWEWIINCKLYKMERQWTNFRLCRDICLYVKKSVEIVIQVSGTLSLGFVSRLHKERYTHGCDGGPQIALHQQQIVWFTLGSSLLCVSPVQHATWIKAESNFFSFSVANPDSKVRSCGNATHDLAILMTVFPLLFLFLLRGDECAK